MIRLFAFVKRREGMSRQEFFDYWHHRHGPLIRDTPELSRHLIDYAQHPATAEDRSGWDGVAVQTFASWDDLTAMISGPAGETMRADEAAFLDPDSLRVVFTGDPVVVISADDEGAEGSEP